MIPGYERDRRERQREERLAREQAAAVWRRREDDRPSLDEIPPLGRDLIPATVGVDEPRLIDIEAATFAAVREWER